MHDDLMICDADGPVCIAGVFGGLNSGIKNSSTALFLEVSLVQSYLQSEKPHSGMASVQKQQYISKKVWIFPEP